MVGFLIERKERQIVVRLNCKETTNAAEFKKKYTDYLEEAQKNKEKLRVLFDTRQACSLSVLLELSAAMIPFFAITIKKLSEEVVEKCLLIIPDEDLAKNMQNQISRLGGTVPTTILHKMPGES